MKIKAVFHVVGVLVMLIGAFMMLPALVAFIMNDPMNVRIQLLECSALTIICGAITFLKTRQKKYDFSLREVFAVVTVGWLAVTLTASVPFIIIQKMSLTDSFFEMMSGLTTTGSTILSNIDDLPQSLNFWRCFCNWLGGLGIVILSMLILPVMGSGGYMLFKAESTGPQSEQMTARAIDTAKLLWGIYITFTLMCTCLYIFLGMPIFESICHGLSTLSTGGYSPLGSSFAGYSQAILWVSSVFMLIAATNFNLHIKFFRKDWFCYWKDEECRWYLIVYTLATVAMAFLLIGTGSHQSAEAFADTSFQTATLISSCGYASDNFDLWPTACKGILLTLMFIGGCGGSTTGGLKMARAIMLIKFMFLKIRQMLFPHSLTSLQMNGQRVNEAVINKVLAFFFAYMFIYAFIALMLCFVPGMDLISAISGSIACVGNMGPGFAEFGPNMNFAWLPDWSKWMLAFGMFLGRLEVFTVIVVFSPSFWKK